MRFTEFILFSTINRSLESALNGMGLVSTAYSGHQRRNAPKKRSKFSLIGAFLLFLRLSFIFAEQHVHLTVKWRRIVDAEVLSDFCNCAGNQENLVDIDLVLAAFIDENLL